MRPVVVALVALGLLFSLVAAGPSPSPKSAAGTARTPLTNLAHLDFLRDETAPPAQGGHTTYRLEEEPRIGTLWTYADRNADGTYRRIGGGPYDPTTGHYSQGAFNADDVSRAAVVYLRHWRQNGAEESRDAAYDLLRGLTYHQTASGPNAGNVVLWMQSDGELTPSPNPVELPNPSDSGASYWLARTVWALGEGYRAFRTEDPEFARFLKQRMQLAVSALDRQVLSKFGEWRVVDGKRVPAWLVVDGADATAEAVLGLTAYVEATEDPVARRTLDRLAEGVAALSGGDARSWPHGAVLPWAQSQSVWHAWASQMPAALALASAELKQPALMKPALNDAAVFTPYLLTAGGPDNGWLPVPIDRVQIAYGIDSRVQSLVTIADLAERPGLTQLAGLTAAWYFGANAAGEPTYDPDTGITYDGVEGDGRINRNSGAESTIHGLLSMLALDAHPDAAAIARSATTVVDRNGPRIVEAESGKLSGDAKTVRPDSAWTGRSQWSGGSYLELGNGGAASWSVPASNEPRLVQPVVIRTGDRGLGSTRWSDNDGRLGGIDHGRGGEQSEPSEPGALLPVTLARELPAGSDQVSVTARGSAEVDALLVRPLVTSVAYGGGQVLTLLHSAARSAQTVPATIPGSGPATVQSYDSRGRLVHEVTDRAGKVKVRVLPGGFSLVRFADR
ncbi:hypothetical protein ACFTTN_03625 [Streptomyces niveus]|uniref:hypothetical protein n=1 Tax=Streptomyces niveus TaxID=193462 RepID=UPI00363F2004